MDVRTKEALEELQVFVNNSALNLSPSKIQEMLRNKSYYNEFEEYVDHIMYALGMVLDKVDSTKEYPKEFVPVKITNKLR